MYPIKIELDKIKNLEELKDFIDSKKIKLILFGETHSLLNELPIQEEIIKNITFGFYLYELLEEEKIIDKNKAEEFLKKPDSEKFSIISTFGELKPIIKLASKFNISVIGCDIKNMLRKDRSFLEKTNLTQKEMENEEKIMEQRERKQFEVVNEYLSKSDEPLFVSIGLYHIRKNSYLIKNLKENFLICYPLTKGNKLWETEDFDPDEISYVITSKEKYLKN